MMLALVTALLSWSPAAVVRAANNTQDLGTVLSANANLSTYYGLVKVRRRTVGGLAKCEPNR